MAFECVPTTRQFARVDTRVKYTLAGAWPFLSLPGVAQDEFRSVPFKANRHLCMLAFKNNDPTNNQPFRRHLKVAQL
jgi:hypothetical protein